MGVGDQCHAQLLYLWEKRLNTHCTGDWVGPRASVDRCKKSYHRQDLIPETAGWLSCTSTGDL